MIRRLRAVLLAGLGAGLLLCIPALPRTGDSRAHTELRSSSPAAGATLDAAPATRGTGTLDPHRRRVLTFNQAVQTEFAQVAVLDAAQAHLETGAASVVGENVTQAVTRAVRRRLHSVLARCGRRRTSGNRDVRVHRGRTSGSQPNVNADCRDAEQHPDANRRAIGRPDRHLRCRQTTTPACLPGR